MVPAAQLFFQPGDLRCRIDRPAEFRLHEIAQLRLAHFGAERILAVPAGQITVIQALLVEKERAALQEAVDRHPSEPGQPVSEAHLPVAVQSVAIKEEAPGGLHDLVRRHAGVEAQFRLRGSGPDPREHGALAELRPKQQRFERAPEYVLVKCGVPVLVEHGKQRFQLLILITAPCGAEDDVPVDVSAAAAVIGLEVRRKGVVPCAVPYDVVGAPFLELGNILIHSSKAKRKLRR